MGYLPGLRNTGSYNGHVQSRRPDSLFDGTQPQVEPRSRAALCGLVWAIAIRTSHEQN